MTKAQRERKAIALMNKVIESTLKAIRGYLDAEEKNFVRTPAGVVFNDDDTKAHIKIAVVL